MPHIRMPSVLLFIVLTALSHAAPASAPLPVEYEPSTGKLLLEVRDLDQDLVYTYTLSGGLGTTSPILDRGQLGDNTLVRFERHGPRVLLVQRNDRHRALGGSEALKRSVEESFPRSVLASMEVVGERDGNPVVDATGFFLEDIFGAGQAIGRAGRGKPALDAARSYIDASRTASHPRNTEVHAVLTFAVDEPDAELRRHAPDGRSVTLAVHHSFIALPDNGYTPRAFHPRAGIFPHVLFDFTQGLETDYRQRWIWRWRLVPSDKEAYLRGELVEPETPIVYHLDPAIPEPYRSAFREGGLWYNTLFESAGFKDAFRIRDLPEGADPMDARYNMIHWVHRRERGPSVGPNYRDPRTGEILRTIVRMDSYRSLVNHDIWMGFRPAAGPEGLALTSEEMAMARRRQHSAHEIGHTLGLAHNFIAATHDRASVMDYPVPLARLDADGNLDISEAYAPGPGPHDEFAIRYAYTWFPDAESEREGLAEIVREAQEKGLRFITGGAARPDGGFPDATVWVEGPDMMSALARTMEVRRVLIDRFDERALEDGEPYWFLNKRFAHVYKHHFTALQGTIKHLGGMEFAYALMGEDVEPTRRIPADDQRAALDAVLEALEPGALRIPQRVVELMAPVPFGWDTGWQWSGEDPLLETDAGEAFNPLYAAHALAQEITDGLLQVERANRVASFHAQDGSMPSLDEVVETLLERTWGRRAGPDPQHAELGRVVQRAALDSLLDLAGHERVSNEVRITADRWLKRLLDELQRPSGAIVPRGRVGETDAAHRARAGRDIGRYFAGDDDPSLRPRPEPITLPWP